MKETFDFLSNVRTFPAGSLRLSAPLLCPDFPRVHDWLGLWSIEPRAFDSLIETLHRMDLAAHVAHAAGGLISAMEKTPPIRGQSVALVSIRGTMMKGQSSIGGTSTVQVRRDIRQAVADPEVGGIVLAIDSPGGTTAGTDDLAAEVRAAAKAKPVVAHIDDMGASAAYWAASQANEIYANSPTAMVGSIGTFTTVYDSSEAAAQNGIKAYRFATGPLKGAGAPGTALTEEQRSYYQALIDDSQKTFDAAVKRGRGMSDRQLAEVRHGGVMLADRAIGAKLIDGVRPLSKTMDEMQRRISTGKSSSVHSGFSNAGGGLPTRQKLTLPMMADS